MNSRSNLQIQLEAVLGSRNVYFQPPETLKIKYPAIIYSLSDVMTRKANNEKYLKYRKYNIILIHNDPDNDLIDLMLDTFSHCSLERTYKADNLYHYVFDVFY